MSLPSLRSLLAALVVPAVALLSPAQAERILPATEHGLQPGTAEAGDALRALLLKAQAFGEPCTITLEPGEYHFYTANAKTYQLFISNHDQQPTHPVGVALENQKDLTIRGGNCTFVFHGSMLPVLVKDCENTCLEGIAIRYASPFSAEGRIVEQTEHHTTLEMHPASQWRVKEGQFFNVGEGWNNRVAVAIAFLEDGRMVPSGKAGDIIWNARAEQLSPTRVRFAIDSRPRGLRVGNVLVLRSYLRPQPAVFLLQSTNTSLRHLVIHDSMGMGILGQRCTHIAMEGGGVIRLPGRYGTTGADATHFSNCRGHLEISGALFEGMMDDAINVHATCLCITKLISPTELVVRFMHHQAYGFEVLRPGEMVRFIHGKTLENNPQQVHVKEVIRRDDRTLHLTFHEPIPAGIGVGDALENAYWHPSVTFCGNTVRHNRARGALFTTPRAVRVENNDFVWSSGSAILLAGDAQGWYESGSCQSVIIRNNRFDHCLTSLYQFTDAIISICPEVKQPDKQKERYHRNIHIEHNLFLTHRVPLLSAISADELRFRDNSVIYDNKAPTLFEGVPYHIRHCGEVELQEIKVLAP